MIQTTSVMLQTLCVPCACHCRYCLLSWDGRTIGADWARSRAVAGRFADWIGENRPELRFHFSFGYSMEHPALPEALDFLRSLGSVGAEYLHCDGLRIRDEAETEDFVRMLRAHGVKHLNFTVYGTEACHDRFAARTGDFSWLLRLRDAAREAGLETSVGVTLTRENAPQLEALLDTLGTEGTRLFVPHAEGRGAQLEPIRLRREDYERLSERGRALMNREALDEAYYAPIPPFAELLKLYGDPAGECFFSARDLAARYQKRWLTEHGLKPYDVTDERQSGSRRF